MSIFKQLTVKIFSFGSMKFLMSITNHNNNYDVIKKTFEITPGENNSLPLIQQSIEINLIIGSR